MKKIIAIALICMMMLSLLASCKKDAGGAEENKDGNGATTVATTVVTEDAQGKPVTLDLPDDLTFGGQELRILVRTQSIQYHDYKPSETPSLVELAVFDRNTAVKELLDIEFKFYDMNGYSSGRQQFSTAIRTSVMGGGDDYHIVSPGSYFGTALALEGCFVDLADTEYIDLEQSYWWKGFTEKATINGKTFLSTGDYSVDALACMEVVFFNKTMLRDLKLEDPYQLVEEGKWTIEKMLEMAAVGTQNDLGDGTFEKYGLVFGTQGARAIPYSADAFLLNLDGNGGFTITEDVTKVENILAVLNNAFTNNAAKYYTSAGEFTNKFLDGDALFMLHSFEVINGLRASEVDYGILIFPKYNSSQKDYITGVAGDTSFAITSNLDDEELEMAASSLQALMYYSYQYITPAFFESTLKGQVSRDEQSYNMLDRIRSTVKYDVAMLWSDTVLGSDYFTSCMPGGKYATVSGWQAAVGQGMRTTLNNLLESEIFN